MSEQHLLDLLRPYLPSGIAECCACHVFLRLVEGLPAGQVSHGLCTPCAERLYGWSGT